MPVPDGPELTPEREPDPDFDDPAFDEDLRDDFDPADDSGAPQSRRLADESGPQASGQPSLKPIVWGALGLLAAGLLYFSTIGSPTPAGDETVHANWSAHVQPVTEHNEQRLQSGQQPQVRHVNIGGAAAFSSTVLLSSDDADTQTTSAVREALENGDAAAADAAVQQAQAIPELTAEQQEIVAEKLQEPAPQPRVTSGMSDAISSGDAEFFHIYLYDSCDEDGDIVEVQLNGVPFALVPITHSGATLSVPIASGAGTSISLKGVHDGVGGITVACRTSQGDYFVSRMMEGQVQLVGVTP